MGIELNRQQIHALYDIESWWHKRNDQIFEISGAAGTGKTFLVNYFIEQIGLEPRDVAFTAFAGKAAMQLARNGLPASTIHSLIYDHEKVADLDENGKVQYSSSGKILTKFEFRLKERLFKNPKLIVVDEASMVNKKLADDLLSYGIPVIALGDLNQLPPVMGNPVFLVNPNIRLTQIMRQAENDPIVWLSQRVLNRQPLMYGNYGKSTVWPKDEMTGKALVSTDVVLTATNKRKKSINELFRTKLLNIRKLEVPQVGEKIICTKNNWSRSINDVIYLMNGICGTIDFIDMSTFNGKGVTIDFKPDFLNTSFRNVSMDYKYLFDLYEDENKIDRFGGMDQFEFAYAMTTHKSQGSQWKDVTFLDERAFDADTYRKLVYTAITRAREAIHIYK